MHRYRTIVIDPAWLYESNGRNGGTRGKYVGVPTPRLMAMPVKELADPAGSHLYLWTTNAFLEEGLWLMGELGWEYRTTVTWVKADPQTARYRIGTGSWFRGTTEHALFGVRGRLGAGVHNLPTHFLAPRTDHSKKPEAFYEIVEAMSPYFRLEMFARGQGRAGWDRWGDQAGSGEGRVFLPEVDAALSRDPEPPPPEAAP